MVPCSCIGAFELWSYVWSTLGFLTSCSTSPKHLLFVADMVPHLSEPTDAQLRHRSETSEQTSKILLLGTWHWHVPNIAICPCVQVCCSKTWMLPGSKQTLMLMMLSKSCHLWGVAFVRSQMENHNVTKGVYNKDEWWRLSKLSVAYTGRVHKNYPAQP